MEYLLLPVFVENPRYNYQVDLGEETYQVTIHWNVDGRSWYLDLLGLTNDEDRKGIRLATGWNLFAPSPSRTLGALYVLDGEQLGEDPTFEGLGGRWVLFYTDDPDYIL